MPVSFSTFSWNTYSYSLIIFRYWNINYLTVGPVNELIVLILKHQEPFRVSAIELHVIGFSSTLDIKWLIVVSSSDCQRLLMEIPDLSLSFIWSLDDDVSVADEIEKSVTLHYSFSIEIGDILGRFIIIVICLFTHHDIIFNIMMSCYMSSK